jgi:predicted lipoprotein with Yx(FWY)xxD motif
MRQNPKSLITVVAGLALLAPTALVTHAGAPAQANKALVKTTSAKMLVTSKGLTLYVFAIDKPNVSNCYATCAKFWPPLTVPAGMKPATTMPGIAGKFGTATRKDGTSQLTLSGSPLYTFSKDKGAGDMYGQGLFASGGYWWAVVVPGSKSSGSGSSSGAGGSGGYGQGH